MYTAALAAPGAHFVASLLDDAGRGATKAHKVPTPAHADARNPREDRCEAYIFRVST